MSIAEKLQNLKSELPSDMLLVAVSKFHPEEAVLEAYDAGQRDFGENRPQELCRKAESLPKDIRWHFLGHLQTNKLRMVLPYAYIVQSVDSRHLLSAINDWGKTNSKHVKVLLELHVAAEQTKQGMTEDEILDILFDAANFSFIDFCGLMSMATNTSDDSIVEADFSRVDSFMAYLVDLFPELRDFRQLSIGMSGDWKIAVRNGATMVRIGTSIFGERNYGDQSQG